MSRQTIKMYKRKPPLVRARALYKGCRRIDYVPMGHSEKLSLVFSKENMTNFKFALGNSNDPILKALLTAMITQEQLLHAKDTECIPTGSYCHGKDDQPRCPYWAVAEDMPHQMDGYCKYLERGDWELEAGHSLLWDQCKACGIKDNT
jgi:hypothetical protein